MAAGEPDLGEKAISKVAEASISSQLDEVEQINVDVRTDPLKFVQGKVDSITIEGEGMVMKQDLRMESLEVVTGNVAVNPLSAIAGKVELTEPAEAMARIVLTEVDLNRAFAADFIRSKMKNLQVEVQGKPVVFDVESISIQLLADGKMGATAVIKPQDTGAGQRLVAKVVPYVAESGYQIGLKDLFLEETLSPPELTTAVITKLMELCDLRNFDIPGISLKLRTLSVEAGKMILQSATQVHEIPSM